MKVGLRELAAVGLVLLCGVVSFASLLLFSAFQAMDSGVSMNVSNFSYSLGDCEPGDTGYVRFFDTTMNLTVSGPATHRDRLSCHSSGLASISGREYAMDLYRVGSGDQCFVLVSLQGGNETENCQGDWPGYAPTGG